MKYDMASLLCLVALALSVAEGALVTRVRALVSGATASATALVQERESFEARSHTQLSQWCNATLPAQGSRRSALHHLLAQAQSTASPTEASDGPALVQLEAQAASLGGQVERERLQAQASQSMKAKEMTALKLDLDDATRDLEALQHAYDHLGGAKAPVNAGLKVAAELLAKAKETKRQAQEKVTLLQSSKAETHANLSQMEAQYRSKKADIVSFQHQFFTTQRSLDVLTSALEAESGYLADLQSICGAEMRVHERLESHVLPMLRKAPTLLATEGSAPKLAVPSKPASPAAPAKAVVAAKPAAPKVEVPEPVAAPKLVAPKAHALTSVPKHAAKAAPGKHSKHVSPKHVKTVAAVKAAAVEAVAVKPAVAKKHHKKAAAVKAGAAKPAVSKAHHKKVAPKLTAPKPVAVKLAAKRKHGVHKAAVAPKPAAAKAPATKHKHAVHKTEAPKPPAPAKLVVHKPVHKKVTVKAKALAPKKPKAPPPPPAAGDDDEPEALPPPAPVAKHHHAAKKAPPPPPAAADDDDDAPPPAPVAKHHHGAKKAPPPPPAATDDDDEAPPPPAPVAKAKVPLAKIAMTDPFADDDDAAAEAPPPPAPVAKAHGAAKAHAKATPPPAKAAMKDPFADDDDDSSTQAAPPAPKAEDQATSAAAKAPMKDPFADDDDDTAAPPPPPAPKHKHQRPGPKVHAKQHGKKQPEAFLDGVYDSAGGNMPSGYATWKPEGGSAHAPTADATPTSTENAKKSMMAMFGSDSDDSSATSMATPSAPSKPAVTVDDSAQPATAAKTSGAKAAEAAFDSDDDAVSSPKPVARPAKAMASADGDDSFSAPTHAAATAKAAEAAFDGDDDSFDPKAAFNAAKTGVAAVKGPSVSAMQQELDSDEAIDHAFPAQSSSQLQIHKRNHDPKAPAQKKTFMDGVYDAASGNLPNQYSAWSPGEQSASSSKSKAQLAQMEADFDDDDDDAPATVPKKKAKHHHQAPAPAPPPPKASSDDGVVYDDDDLPKHHASNMRGLEGGWQALMKKTPAQKVVHSPKLDPDVAIMESLYTKDGALPSQYTAWTPDDGPKTEPAAPPPAAPQPQNDDASGSDGGGETMDLEAAAKAFAKDPDKAFDFMQVALRTHDPLADLVHLAAAPSARSVRGTSFLEASASSVDVTRATAATTLLEQYAEVLKSKPLRQLAKAKLSASKLEALFQQLRKVDPLVGKAPAVAAAGKQAQAEKMCKYFQEHMQTASPMQKAVSLIEGSSNQLAESVSRNQALLEEIDARTQLQRTMEQDILSLTTLAGLAKQGQDTSSLVTLGSQLTGAAAAAVAASAEGVQEAHAELKDLFDLALQKRTAVLEGQKAKLASLQADAKASEADLAQKKTKASTSQAAIEKARKKLTGIASSCDTTLDALARRRHAGHMETHAIELALKVLGNEK